MIVAIIALVVAASGSAFAAGRLVSGDSLIKKHSLSGDRLRNHSVTGQEIKASSLGQVPSAKTAANAQALGGHPASAFALASGAGAGGARTGLVTANAGQTVKLASFGPFTVTLQCNDEGDGTFDAAIMADSTTSNSEANGIQMTPGTPQQILDGGFDSAFSDTSGGAFADFVAPPDVYEVYMTDAIFQPGTTAPCAASLIATKS
jgi:hypothetical protein